MRLPNNLHTPKAPLCNIAEAARRIRKFMERITAVVLFSDCMVPVVETLKLKSNGILVVLLHIVD